MLFYGISALMEFLMNPDVMGANVNIFRVYYVLAAPLVGLLGAGVVYLLVRRSIANYFLAFVVVLSIGLAVTGFTTPLDESIILESFSGELGEAFRAASHAYPMTVRIFAIILNSIGGTILIGGALYSYIRDRSRTYNLLIALGALLPMIGGSALGFFGNPDVFFEFELGGTVFLFLGFILSDRYIKTRETKIKRR
jgi:cation transport ATPase